MSSAPLVYVVDDSQAMCRSLEALLMSAGFHVIAFSDPAIFLRKADSLASGAVLLDLRMPRISGLDVLKRLGPLIDRFAVIMITGHGEIDVAVQAIKAGAKDFVQKPFRDDVLIDKIEREFAQLSLHPETIVGAEESLGMLTQRERQVALGLSRGLANKQIARELNISVRTVEMHRARAMQRLGCRTFADFLRAVLQSAAPAEKP